MLLPGKGSLMLADIQAGRDDRNLALDEVGIAGIRYPVAVADREHGKQDTVAEVSMSVDLPPEVKGAHLSRFVEILHETAGEITPQTISAILGAIRERLTASTARLEASFPLFLPRFAPVTGSAALMDYQCWLAGELDSSGPRIILGVRVPVTSVCPCSKAISDYGAHNQRATITIRVRPRDEDGLPAAIWAEELIEVAEAAASSPVFPLLKRPDERHVTMRAHDHPVFVEDMARATAVALGGDARVAWFSVEAASEESIHNHGAFARIQSPGPTRGLPQLSLRDIP
jgi:GTP cyclohydrolase I